MPRIVYSPEHEKFTPGEIYNPRVHALEPHPDSPDRVATILDAVSELSWPVIRETGDYNLDPYFGVHSYDMISLFREADQGISAGMLEPPLIPTEFAVRRLARQPGSLEGRLGWFCTDARTPLMAGSWAAACGALSATVAGADLILSGERLVYVIARPAGHHAGSDFYGGGCYLNNAAGAVVQLSRRGRVAVLEIGFHHGQGTQDIFYGSKEITFASVHVDPRAVYPHFAGYDDEKGEGKGKGTTRNFTLSLPLSEKAFFKAVDHAVAEVRKGRPQVLVVSLGADLASAPSGGAGDIPDIRLPLTVYAEAAVRVARLGIPTLVIQEEGNDPSTLGPSVHGFLEGLWSVLSNAK
ncbi:hypothetical protein [Salinispira pacifica]